MSILNYDLYMGKLTAGPAVVVCFSCFSCALLAAFSSLFFFFISAPVSFGASTTGAFEGTGSEATGVLEGSGIVEIGQQACLEKFGSLNKQCLV